MGGDFVEGHRARVHGHPRDGEPAGVEREVHELAVTARDPQRARTVGVAVDGRVVLPGHVGVVYQALGATYTGRGRSQTLRLLPDGSALSGRAVAKIRSGERGWRYAVEQLVAAGARAPRPSRPRYTLSATEAR